MSVDVVVARNVHHESCARGVMLGVGASCTTNLSQLV